MCVNVSQCVLGCDNSCQFGWLVACVCIVVSGWVSVVCVTLYVSMCMSVYVSMYACQCMCVNACVRVVVNVYGLRCTCHCVSVCMCPGHGV